MTSLLILRRKKSFLESPPVQVRQGKREIAFKVVDIFGNDKMGIIEANS